MYIFIYEEFPFDAESELELQIKIGENKINPPVNAENKDFDVLIEKLLEKEPEKRLTDIDEILECEYFKWFFFFILLLEKLLEKNPEKRLTDIDKILECDYFKN